MQDVVIVAATRTAIGRFQGGLADVPATKLGEAVVRRLLADTGVEPGAVSEVILGQVLTAGAGQNTARQTSIFAGLPDEVPAMTINKVCGSGLKAVHLGSQAIRCGEADVIIAGGQESMSLAPYVLPKARTGLRMGHASLVDSMIQDGLWDAFNDFHMGITAENLAQKYSLSREAQDAFAAASHRKAAAAINEAASRMRSPRWKYRSARATRRSSTPTSSRAATPPLIPWAACAPPSRRTALSPPATPRHSTTAPPR